MNRIKNTLLFLISGVAINTASGQEVRSKIGNNPTMIDNSATLELDSTNKGFLPPRMTMEQRDAIEKPIPNSLMVWCIDCNRATEPPTGQLCVWMDKDKAWVPIMMNVTYKLTTDSVAINTDNSATVNGTLVSISGVQPTETGVVYMEIKDNDFQTLPVLDPSGDAAPNCIKVPTTTAVNDPGLITITIYAPALSTTKSYYFRAYARNPFGISYGNAFVFTAAPPVISTPIFTNMNRNTLLPTFAGKLTVNAGTQGTITEYGYCNCSSDTNNPPAVADNPVVLSTTTTLDALNASLSSKNFIANPLPIDLVNNYDVQSLNPIHFRYYVIVKENTSSKTHTYYSQPYDLTPIADPVTGGTAIAKLITIDPPLKQFKIGEASTTTVKVFFDIIKKGRYNFEATDSSKITGDTTGLSVQKMEGRFDTIETDKTLDFTISGTPETSLEGNSFKVSKAVTLNTGKIKGFPAICDGSVPTAVVELRSSKTGATWMDRNLGASRIAQSVDDYKAFGCLYQWGRGNDGAASMNWASATSGSFINGMTAVNARSDGDSPGNQFIPIGITDSPYSWRSTPNDSLWQGVYGKNNPCPKDYRIPTLAELEAELADVTNATTAYSSPLKLVFSKTILGRGLFYKILSRYWSSSSSNSDYHLVFGYYVDVLFGSNPDIFGYVSAASDANSVRCIKN